MYRTCQKCNKSKCIFTDFHNYYICNVCNTETWVRRCKEEQDAYKELILKNIQFLKADEDSLYKAVAIMMTKTGVAFDDDGHIYYSNN